MALRAFGYLSLSLSLSPPLPIGFSFPRLHFSLRHLSAGTTTTTTTTTGTMMTTFTCSNYKFFADAGRARAQPYIKYLAANEAI